jgi:hypothetical protein
MATENLTDPTPECKHEVDFALMQRDIGSIQSDITVIKDAITGNGKPGLKTDVAVHSSQITRLFVWLGILSTSFLGICAYAAFKG